MAMTFFAVLKSTCYRYFPVSQIIDWIFEGFSLEMEGLDGKEFVRNGEGRRRSKRTCAYDGERGVIFLLLCCVCTNWKNVVGCLAIRFIAFIVNYLKFSISPSLKPPLQ